MRRLRAAALGALLLAGCSEPQPPGGTGVSSTGARPDTAGPRSAAGPATTTPTTYAAPGVLARLGALRPEGLPVTPLPAGSPVIVEACPGAAFVTRPQGPTALVRQWGDAGGPARAEVYLAAVVFPGAPDAARALAPVRQAIAACPAPPPQRDLSVAVSHARTADLLGAPGGSLDIAYTTPQGTAYDHVTVLQVGNVLLRLTATAPEARRATDIGTRSLTTAVAAVRAG
ncbi:MAG TPA: hypothetical protein VFJ94_12930 [Intrasporangium sp.]|uniref:hypothetical protein n=1 Tax=Intrasporangium sp. TaxID=1925024 RepID=UPI002D78F00E|nr:hypothetical protein [Intrasporangium sp.]HET7399416.1 hypothetical protein [Intrasporangium sp.]